MMQRIEQKTFLPAMALILGMGCSDIVHADIGGENKYLDMDLAELMNITLTSVSKKEQTLSDAAAAVFVITQEDIRRSGVTTIPDALAMAPGLHIAKSSASSWSVTSRGFGGYTSNKLLVLLDGRSLYSPAYSGTFWDAQNTLLEDIDRIEIMRGPCGTMWGANAVNGVINIITKKAEDTQGTLLRLGTGNQEKISAGTRYGGKISDTAFGRFYLTHNDHDSNALADSGIGIDANDGWQPAQGGFRLDGKPNSSRAWTLQGDLYQNNEDRITYPYWMTQPPYFTAKSGNADINGANLLGRWREEFSSGNALTFTGYYDRTSREEDYLKMQFDTVDFDLQYEVRLGQRQNLTMGTGYRHIASEFDATDLLTLTDRRDHLFNAFFQNEIGLVRDVLLFTLGAKYEHNDYSDNEWQPSARLMWKLLDGHSIWASVARAVRTPSTIEDSGQMTMGIYPTPPDGIATVTFTGNPEIDSEVLWAYETGFDGRPAIPCFLI